ncbi:MAG: hypothetical protein HOV97_09880 [Nonomuraea sp.]|nr:hypothetical protein [Nonomuraea sp.]
MRTTLRNAAKLAAAVAAGGGLLVAAPAAAQASTNGTVRPAVTNVCGGWVEVHYANGGHVCLGNGIWKPNPSPSCGVDWINTGNQWAAFYWGPWAPASTYQPGMGPGSTWWGGSPVCVSEVDVNT